MNKYFNTRRFGLLCKNEVLSNYKSWGLYLITIIGIYTVIAMIITAVNKFTMGTAGFDPNALNYMFPGFLFIGGYIVSALTFSDINDKFKSSLWFSLPGSTLEKYTVGALISSIGYGIFIIAAFVLASSVSVIFTQPLFGSSMAIFNVRLFVYDSVNVGPNALLLILIYILTHSMFLVGSIVFRKGAFIKTVLVYSVVQTILSIIIAFIGLLVLKSGISESWDTRMFTKIIELFDESSAVYSDGYTFGYYMAKWTLIFGIPFSLFFNVVGYFKLAEKEVKGGI